MESELAKPIYRYTGLSYLEQRWELSAHREPVGAISLSPNANYLACGDDKGTVSIAAVFPSPRITQYLKASSPIRTLVWHPVSSSPSLIVGAKNGDVWLILLNDAGKIDHEQHESSIDGRIDAMAITKSGNQFAVGHSKGIGLVDGNPFANWPPKRSLSIPEEGGPIRGMHYLGEDVLLVTAYSTSPKPATTSPIWGIDVNPGRSEKVPTYMRVPLIASLDIFLQPYRSGSSALSPDGRLLAVTNVRDGIDWYSIVDRRYLGTTPCDLGKMDPVHYVVGVSFLDNDTVVAGHGKALLAIISPKRPTTDFIEFKEEKSSLIQLPAVALRDGKKPVIVASCTQNIKGQNCKILFVQERRLAACQILFYVLIFGVVVYLAFMGVVKLQVERQVNFTFSRYASFQIPTRTGQTVSTRASDGEDLVSRACYCPCPEPTRTVTAMCVTHTVTEVQTQNTTWTVTSSPSPTKEIDAGDSIPPITSSHGHKSRRK
ncbi:hypothetical protein BDN72DRAFT_897953 [Pluteus cervinus]|uniref:Uncharacterized protein n=1 Tax=Pluteus cervinus TaxID=181527 RepID=A0ACD3ASX9_9AGAR|nr:hypothetical protein BDN72DRAFT_897953 [Pluteus cervinus]